MRFFWLYFNRNFVSRLGAFSPEQHDPRHEQGIRLAHELAASFLRLLSPPPTRHGVCRPDSADLVAQSRALLGRELDVPHPEAYR
jgi:hypothetical protein